MNNPAAATQPGAAPSAPKTPATPPAPGAPKAGGNTPPKADAPPPPPPKNEPAKSSIDDAWGELDRLAANEPPPKDPAAPEPPKPPKDKPADPPKDPATPPAEPPKADDKPKKIDELRTVYETTKAERDALKAKIEEFEKKKNDDPEKTALTERLTAAEKRREELENEIRFARYEKSEEYLNQYEKPIERALEVVFNDIRELTIQTESGQRQATPQDFNTLLKLPLREAAAKAQEWFGEAHTEILLHRRKILDLNTAREEAVERFRKEGGEREKKAQAESIKQRETLNRVWTESIEEAAKRFPQHFAPDENDPEGNEVLAKGQSIADAAFSNPNLSPEQMVKLHAVVRNKAAAFDREVLRNKRLREENESLKAKLKDFEQSVPGPADGRGSGSEAGEISPNDELDSIAQSNAQR